MKIFSGIRPSGQLHLGNYLGAIKNWLKLQDEAEETVFGIVDYHAITTPFEPDNLKDQVRNAALDFLAAGIDPEKSLLIRQSRVPQHTELAWIFNTITPVSWLNRLPTYQEQVEKNPKYNHMGLMDYPVLMAADILAYKANAVPVGEDQRPHIDLTNEIAKKFNHMFGDTFEPVKPIISEDTGRIMSLQDPTNKMSKTGDEGIALSDSADAVRDKIKKAVTDSGSEIKYDRNEKPAISNLLNIYSQLSDKKIEEIEQEYEGKSYSEFKDGLTRVINEFLSNFQEKRAEIEKNGDVELILTKSEESAIVRATSTLTEVKEHMGLLK
jgi:tryptophanyl-tRNA synthetase